MHHDDDTPDRRFWTTYDHFMIGKEARALRRAHVNAMLRNAWRRFAIALAHAGAQPPKAQRRRQTAM